MAGRATMGRHYGYILDLYLTNVTLDSTVGAKRAQIAAVCGAPAYDCCCCCRELFTRLQIVGRAPRQ